jgi:hypothetical protein
MSSFQTVDGWPVIDGVRVYIDQEGAAWDASCGRCPRCERDGVDTPTDYARRVRGSGYYLCNTCGVMYDEPVWADAESAYMGTVDERED